MAQTKDILEAVLFAAGSPVPTAQLASLCGIDKNQVEDELIAFAAEKKTAGALQLVQVAGGWQMVTKSEFAPWIARLREERRLYLSRASIEVLAIVAYRQPVTRSEVEQLRGVSSTHSLGLLLKRNLITLSGRKDAPGRPWLYSTSTAFLDHFGLGSVEDLPPLEEFAAMLEESEESAESAELTSHLFDNTPLQPKTEQESEANNDK